MFRQRRCLNGYCPPLASRSLKSLEREVTERVQRREAEANEVPSRAERLRICDTIWRDMGAITAKAASALGGEMDLVIRHENVRKVVRTRLKDRIDTSTVPDSQPPTFQYEINDAGVAFFEQEYLKNL